MIKFTVVDKKYFIVSGYKNTRYVLDIMPRLASLLRFIDQCKKELEVLPIGNEG